MFTWNLEWKGESRWDPPQRAISLGFQRGMTVALALDLRLGSAGFQRRRLAGFQFYVQPSRFHPEKSRRRTLQELDVGTMEVQYWFIGLPFFNC
jgi:hypothetical protein